MMNPKIKEIFKILIIPFLLMGVYLIMYALWRVFDFPENAELLIIIKEWFKSYGLWIVFLGALIEGFLLLGQYFPGGFIIFLGVVSAGDDIPLVIGVVLIVCISFFFSYTLNYLVGKYGWYKLLAKFGLSASIEKSKEKLEKQGMSAIFLSYWEPNLASITATAAGVLQIPLKKFSLYSGIGIVVWNIFWGTLVYALGESALSIIGLKYAIIFFLIWVIIILVKNYYWDKRKSLGQAK